jgi:hypothetical protein
MNRVRSLFVVSLVAACAVSLAGRVHAGCPRVVDRSFSFAGAVAIPEDHGYGGRFAYVGNIDLMKVFDISNMENPTEISQIALAGGFIHAIQARGNSAFVWTREAGLRVVDVRDPWRPREIGHFDDGCSMFSYGFHAELLGSYALAIGGYCENGDSLGIQVIDLGDPARPVHVASIEGSFRGFAISDSILVAITSHYPADGWTLDVYDLSDVLEPRRVGSYRMMAREYVWRVAAGGSLAFANTSSGLAVIDFSDPARPTRVVTAYGDYFIPMAVADGRLHAYSLDEWPPKLQILDFSNPANPVEVGACEIPFHGSPYFWPDFALIEGHVVSAHGIQGLLVVDVSTSEQPQIVAQLVESYVSDLAVSGAFAYWLSSKWTHTYDFDSTVLQIADVRDPRSPIDVGLYTTARKHFEDIAIGGTYAYLVGSSGLAAIDISDPSKPREVGTIDGHAHAVAVSGSHAYLASMAPERGIRVIDISDPENLREIAFFGPIDVAVEAIAVSGSHVFVAADGRGGFRVIDVSDPYSPVGISSLDLPGWRSNWWGSMIIMRSHVYLAAGSAGSIVIDVSDPFHPREVGSLDPSTSELGSFDVASIAVSGRKAYAVGTWGLYAYDLSDTQGEPEVVLPYALPFRSIPFRADTAIHGPTVFTADSTAGSIILDLSGCDQTRPRDPTGRSSPRSIE